MEHIEHEEVREGMTIKIWHDEDCSHPRRDRDTFGHMVCFHKKYDIGDRHSYRSGDYRSWDDFKQALCRDEDIAVMLNLYMYDHSGITISTLPFSCPWDSGQIGFVYFTRTDLLKEFGCKRVTKKQRERFESILRDLVEEYDLYLRGHAYGYTIYDANGDTLESCGGYVGYYDAKGGPLEDARVSVDAFVQRKAS